MNIIALTDLHGRTGIIKSLFAQLQAADLIILCGDITHFGRRNEIAGIIEVFRKINPNVVAVSGNCDYPEVEEYLAVATLSLSGMIRDYSNYTLFGLGGSLPCPGPTPNEYTEEEYEEILSGISVPSKRPLIMVSHQPPINTLNDAVSPGNHVGSKAVRQFIERTAPLVCFTGHIHEGKGIDYIGKTAIINPGPAFSGGYARAEVWDNLISTLSILNIHDQ